MKHGHPNKLWMNHKSYTELTLEIIIRKLNTDLMSQCHIHTHVADYQYLNRDITFIATFTIVTSVTVVIVVFLIMSPRKVMAFNALRRMVTL